VDAGEGAQRHGHPVLDGPRGVLRGRAVYADEHDVRIAPAQRVRNGHRGLLGMYVLPAASEQPAALLDWNNNYGDDPNKGVVFHCSNLPKSFFTQQRMDYQAIIAGTVGKENTFGTIDGPRVAWPFTYCRVSTDDLEARLRPMSAKAASPTTCSTPSADMASSRCGTSSACCRRSAAWLRAPHRRDASHGRRRHR